MFRKTDHRGGEPESGGGLVHFLMPALFPALPARAEARGRDELQSGALLLAPLLVPTGEGCQILKRNNDPINVPLPALQRGSTGAVVNWLVFFEIG